MCPHPSRFSMRSVAVALALLGSIGAVLLVSAPTVSATTYVRGVYTTDVTWGVADTFYIATGAVTIRAPWTLTIVPGTTVKFDPGVHLFVDGQLKADGTSAKPITFAANTSSLTPWGGIQFNASSSGSVSWSTFDRVDRAISATDSSPDIISNKVIQAGAGFVFLRSSSYISSNTIVRATNVGVYANASSVQISGNAINNTAVGIQIEQPGFPTISGNRITNVSSGFAMGILVTGGGAPTRGRKRGIGRRERHDDDRWPRRRRWHGSRHRSGEFRRNQSSIHEHGRRRNRRRRGTRWKRRDDEWERRHGRRCGRGVSDRCEKRRCE